MKLYRLEVSFTAVVLADSSAAAEKQALDGVTHKNIHPEAQAFEIKSLEDLPFNVDKFLPPLNGDKNIIDILLAKK